MKISDEDIKKICSTGIYKAGMEYFREGRVHIRVRNKDSIVAAVDSDNVYNVHIGFDGEGRISETFCTCPYYQTMGANCRHIAAALKARQAELVPDSDFSDENDRAAADLCREFEKMRREKKPLHVGFCFNISTNLRRECSYSVSVILGDGDKGISGVESFLSAYLTGGEYKLSKHRVYENSAYSINGHERRILDILSEAYQNKTIGSSFYAPKLTAADFGWSTAMRLLPLLEEADCRFVINGMPQPELRIRHENPDILIDVTATDDCINISIPQSGLAIVPDGSWFLHDGDLYATDSQWQSWFMPLYRALLVESRTQIDFKGANSIAFAINVLPGLRGQKGVVEQGLDSVIVEDKPEFDVYFDRFGDGITAAVVAVYGSISLRLPQGEEGQDKIIVRDYNSEKYVLSHFENFDVSGQSLYLDDNASLYEFLTESMPSLRRCARVHTSESFDRLQISPLPEISSNVRYDKGTDLLEVGFETDITPAEIAGILNAIRHKKKFYRMKTGEFLDIDGKLSSFEVLNSLDFSFSDLKDGKKHLSKYHALYLAGAASAGTVRAEESFRQLMEEIRSIRADIPEYLDSVLREYQKAGVHWMKQLSELGFGGVLADDMGLGKTLEVIAFIMSEKKAQPALVITPSSLTYNWLAEITRFAPGARAMIIDGTKEERLRLIKEINDYDFVITSYPLVRRDIPEYAECEFSYCIIDEAQHIKNPKTLSAKSVKKIKSGGCFALSGTPVENSLSELWSIFDFIMPGYLGTQPQFSERYERPVTRGEESAAELLRGKIKPFIMRRMKYEVLSELPEKIENTFFAELAPKQKKLYAAYLAIAKKEVPSLAASGDNMRILSLLMRLRQICCHPTLIDEAYGGESGKLEMLEELTLQSVAAGHRLLIFSQFTSMLAIISKRLESLGISHFYLDGQTPAYSRTDMADRFNCGERNVFLVSLKAGGTGLNLIGADTVIHYDPWWNPAVTDQASDRAYRIGQTRSVHVIRLAAKGTIEEQILKLQEKKRALAEDMIRTNSASLSNLSREELLELFS